MARRLALRWRVAYLLDRSPRLCWTKLVLWALRGDDSTPFPSGADCRAESLTCASRTCYCSKFSNGLTRREASNREAAQ